MFGPSPIVSSKVNQVISQRELPLERCFFLIRVEAATYAQPSHRKTFADSLTLAQAAFEAGLPDSEVSVDKLTEAERSALIKSYGELVRLRAAAGLTFDD